MTSCPYYGSTERPQISPDGTLRCPKCWQLANRPLKGILDDDSCPACGNPMERGYIVEAHGVYWNDHVPRFGGLGEPLGDNSSVLNWTCPNVRALRCRKCGIIRY